MVLPGRDPQPHLVVLTHRKIFVEETLPFQDAPVEQHRTGADNAQRETPVVDPSAVFAVDLSGIDSSPAANPGLIGVNDLVLRAALQLLELPLQLGRFPVIIAVQKANPGMTCPPNSGVAGCHSPRCVPGRSNECGHRGELE